MNELKIKNLDNIVKLEAKPNSVGIVPESRGREIWLE